MRIYFHVWCLNNKLQNIQDLTLCLSISHLIFSRLNLHLVMAKPAVREISTGSIFSHITTYRLAHLQNGTLTD